MYGPRSPALTRGAAVLAALPWLGLAGCGGAAIVTGEVRYNDRAVPAGKVTFYSEDAKSAQYSAIQDGRYTIKDFPPGPVVVTVETFPPAKGKVHFPKGIAVPQPENASSGGAALPEYVKIPERYSTREHTDLKFTLTRGQQTINLDLK
jgi:hypothetical protein